MARNETSQGIFFKEINDLFPYGVWEETHPRYEELKPRENLKSIFHQIKKNLQKTVIGGSTNEPDIAKNVLKILFCKIFDERYQNEKGFVEFYANIDKPQESSEKIRAIFTKVKKKFEDVFDKNEEIKLDEKSTVFVVQKLQWISLKNSGRDAVADAFEVFIGTALKGEHGQFFTPRNVVRFVINFLDVDETQKIIDPACGTGGFIVEFLRYVWKKIDDKYSAKWKKEDLENEKIKIAKKNIFGCDRDSFLSQTCKAYMCILGDGTTNIWDEDSLVKFTTDWKKKYNIILTNPPFGRKIMVEDEGILKKFTFWQLNSKSKKNKAEPQILFLELCCNLLEKKGKLAIVLLEASIFGNKIYRELRETLLKNYKIIAVFSLPSETFQPFTGVKPAILVLENAQANDDDKIIFANIQNVGHDKRGKILYKYDNNGIPQKDENGNFVVNDELDSIARKINHHKLAYYQEAQEADKVFFITHQDVKQTNDLILIPSYYNGFLNKKEAKINQLTLTFEEIISNGIIEVNKNNNIPTGDEIGSRNYLKNGVIPFIRTSDITNLEIRSNPQHFTSEEIYRKYKDKQDIQPYDILLVKDGKHLVGECAVIMPSEEKIIFASGFYKIRVRNNDYGIDTWNFVYALNNKAVKEQVSKLLFYSTVPHLSNRIKEIQLVFPKYKEKLSKNSKIMKEILIKKFEVRKELKTIYSEY